MGGGDVAVTALTHLCIPIADSWNLDGNSWVGKCMPVSVSNYNNSSSEIEITPNPTSGKVYVTLKNINLTEKTSLAIFDVTGKHVKQIPLDHSKYSLDISDLDKGVYMISFEVNGERFSEKLIKF